MKYSYVFLQFLLILSMAMIVAILAPLSWVMILNMSAHFSGTSFSGETVSATTRVVLLVGVAFFWTIAVLVPVLFFAALWNGRNAFGTTGQARLLGLAIVMVILPAWMYSFAADGVQWIANAISGASESLLPINSYPEEQALNLSESLSHFSFALSKLAAHGSFMLKDLFRTEAVLKIIPLLGLWMICGQLLSPAPANVGAMPASGNVGPGRYWLALSKTAKDNIAYAAILLCGGYLSMAAIIAVPSSKIAQTPKNLTSEALRKTLQSKVIPDDDLNAAASDRPKVEQLTGDLRKVVNESVNALDQLRGLPASANIESFIANSIAVAEQTRRDAEEGQSQAARSIPNLPKLINQVKSRQIEAINEAVSAFERTMDSPMTRSARRKYFEGVQGNFDNQIFYLREALNTCQSMDSDFESWSRGKITAFTKLAAAARQATVIPDSLPGFLNATPDLYESIPIAYESVCQMPPGVGPLPEPPNAGASLGPFSGIGGWLLELESTELTLITGMLGFGLLGAALSSLVRVQTNLDRNVAAVALGGLSAAVIIFLTAKGGLAVFLLGDATPNPYVLFFFCIVGAVYWEEVWDKAKKKFNGNSGGSPPPTSTPSPAPSAAPSPATAPPVSGSSTTLPTRP